MSPSQHVPNWRLPPGVSRGLWDYTQAEHIATDFDDTFATSGLLEYDEQVILDHLPASGRIVDLGCGTGRLLIPLARRGYSCVGVDLSPHMLAVAAEKARAARVEVDLLLANLVELDALADGVADAALCMFATLGMIRGREHRAQAVAHMARILKPGGVLALHVHNRWYNLWVPGGWKWLVSNAVASLVGRAPGGDKFYDFRGIPQLHMHVFTAGELRRLLLDAGFVIRTFLPLDTERRHALRAPWFCGGLRANGFLVVAQRLGHST